MAEAQLQDGKRREDILRAASTIFEHYGFRRASLEEIAREAGISRTGLYHHFSSKEDIFRATAERLHERTHAVAEAATAAPTPLGQRLYGMLDAKLGRIHAVASSRHGGEIVDESNRLCGDIISKWSRRFQKLVAAALRTADDAGALRLADAGFTPDTAASFLVLCAYGLQGPLGSTPTAAQYQRRLDQLVRVTIAGFGGRTA
jgi:AcrR family transcriptional regulator